ncbi:MAG: hypothetical protein ACREEC_00960, partial [Thermoplasmata archaeon]
MSNSLPAVFTLAVIVVVGCSLFTPLFYAEASSRQSLSETRQVAIPQLSAGDHVMVVGTISSLTSPVLAAHWVSSGRSGYWSWNDHDFSLYQGTASVRVDSSALGDSVYGWPHGDDSHEYYYSGDSIAVIGTVTGSNGT